MQIKTEEEKPLLDSSPVDDQNRSVDARPNVRQKMWRKTRKKKSRQNMQ